jgi:beta propeller repeat protein
MYFKISASFILLLAGFLFAAPITIFSQTGDTTKTAVLDSSQKTIEQPALDSTQTLSSDLTQLFYKLITDSSNAIIHYDIAMEYLKIGRKNYALTYLEKTIQIDPSYLDARYHKGDLLLANGKRRSAYQEFLAIMRDYKGDAYLDRLASRFVSPYNVTQITKNSYNDIIPSLSPDGNRIVFQSDRKGNWDIYFMDLNAGESSLVQLTTDPGSDENPSFSSDGRQITFASTREDKGTKTFKTREIFVMDRNGKNVRKVTSSYGSDNWGPAFMDTTSLVFASDRSDFSPHPFWEKTSSIYTIEKSGNFMFKFLGADDQTYIDPSFGGDNILFSARKSDTEYDIGFLPVKGKAEIQYLTKSAGMNIQSNVSGNHQYVGFVSNRDGNFEIYKMQTDGSEQTRITFDDGDDLFPKMNNDGSKIIFCSNRTGNYQIYQAVLGSTSSITANDVITALEKKVASATDD